MCHFRIFLALSLTAASWSNQAGASATKFSLDFTAPSVSNRASVGSPETGLIVFDNSDSNFYGQDSSGSWKQLNVAGNAALNPNPTGATIASATISFSGGTPSVSSQDGTWITSVTDNGTGDTTLNIASGTFGTAPSCVVTNIGSNTEGRLYSTPTTAQVRYTSYTSGGSPQDGDFSAVCVGRP